MPVERSELASLVGSFREDLNSSSNSFEPDPGLYGWPPLSSVQSHLTIPRICSHCSDSINSIQISNHKSNLLTFPRSVCEDQTFRCQRKENWKKEKNNSEKCQFESILQRVICFHGGPK